MSHEAFSFEKEDGVVVVTHVAGFFSCCAIRLEGIIEYFNTHGCRPPRRVDSQSQWKWYLPSPSSSDQDITFDYFQHYDDQPNVEFPTHRVFYDHDDQFQDYQTLSYQDLAPFIQKYFSLSSTIHSIASSLTTKYGIEYGNTCVLFYRGNDKIKETKLCEYSELFDQTECLLQKYPRCRILIQSDETEFIQQAFHRFPGKSFMFEHEVRHMPRNGSTTVDATHPSFNHPFSKNFLAIIHVMSQCRWIVCTSGNCSVFMMYYRGHARNVRQNLNGEWLGALH